MSPTAQKRVLAKERQEKAIALRLTGLNYAAIGKELGTTKAGAHYMVKRALQDQIKRIRHATDQLLELELNRLDEMQAAIWSAALQGHLGAQAQVLRIIDKRCALHGLDLLKGTGSHTTIDFNLITHGGPPPETPPDAGADEREANAQRFDVPPERQIAR